MGALAIPEASLRRLQDAIMPLDTYERRMRYVDGDIVNAEQVTDLSRRYRWDLLWSAIGNDRDLWQVLDGFDDSHIDSALRRLVTPLGRQTPKLPEVEAIEYGGVLVLDEHLDTIQARIAEWVKHLNGLASKRPNNDEAFRADRLNKYTRITMHRSGRDRSVHAFVDHVTGEVYKAAGWKAPAKHVRYRLLDDASFARMIEVADLYGSYLYMR